MQRFRHILFCPLATRGSSAAIRKVGALARRDGAELTIVGVVPEPSRLQRLVHSAQHVESVLRSAQQEVVHNLARCERALGDFPEVTSIVDVGGPALALVERATVAQHDLLVVSSDGGDDETATIRRLLRKCPCPVWVLRPTRATRSRVLAAVDPEPGEHDVNERILDTAASLCAVDGGELHVVNAWELYGEATARSSAFVHVSAVELDQQRERVRTAHEEAVTSLVRERLGDAPTIHVHAGSPPDVICDVVDRERINMVVMGTVGRSGVSGLVMGNTAERLADALRCSLVVVKPPDFVSPILT